MDSGYTGFLFLSLFVLISLLISFRWCCQRMRQYDEMMRGIEEEHERRRQATEDMWIFTVQDQGSPQIRYGDTPSNRSRPMVPGELNKPISDALPSYEEAIKLPPIFPKDTVQHV